MVDRFGGRPPPECLSGVSRSIHTRAGSRRREGARTQETLDTTTPFLLYIAAGCCSSVPGGSHDGQGGDRGQGGAAYPVLRRACTFPDWLMCALHAASLIPSFAGPSQSVTLTQSHTSHTQIVVVNKPFGLSTIPNSELVKDSTADATLADNASASPPRAPPESTEGAADAPGPTAAAPAAAPALTGAPSAIANKHKKRKRTHQELWHDMLRGPALLEEAASLSPDQQHLRPYLETLASRKDAVPRKWQKFAGWGQRTLKCDETTAEDLYGLLQQRFEAEEGGRGDSVMTRLLRHFREVKTVHRLGTSGWSGIQMGSGARAKRWIYAG